jgi:O-antigen/teichoic acid export membrane protein
LFTVGAGVLALLAGTGLAGLGAVAIVAGFLTFGTLARPLGYGLLGTYRLATRHELREMARSATPLMLNELLANVFFQIDILVIQSLEGTEMVGKYNASYKFIAALTVIPIAVALPLFPALVRAATNPEELGRWFVLAVIGLPIVVAFTVFADGIVKSFWGERFLPEGGDVLRILIWFLPFAFVNVMLQQVLISIDRLRTIATSFVAVSALNVALNLALLPVLGIVAAAYATVAAEIARLIFYGMALRGRGLMVQVPGPLLKPTVAAAAMAGVAILVAPIGWFAGMVAGGIAYLAVMFVTRGIRREDVTSAFQAIRSRSD